MTTHERAYVNYDVYLRFGAFLGRKARDWTEFLDYLPYLLQPICRKEIQYEVESVKRGATVVDLHLTITVRAPPEPKDGVPDSEARRLVNDPVVARTTAALMLWFGSLRKSQEGPLTEAWAAWCAQEGIDPRENTLPIYLYAHGLHMNYCDRPLPLPQPPQNLTADPQPLDERYDGGTQTST